MNPQDEPKPAAKSYGKYSKKQWFLIYIVAAVIVYGLIYYFVINKDNGAGDSTNTGGGIYSY